MEYFFDTEFIEGGKTIDLISIGIVCEDGRELYLLNFDCNYSKASKWVKLNVLNLIPEPSAPRLYVTVNDFRNSQEWKAGWRNKSQIAKEVIHFCDPEIYGEPEFWAYYADYDWVAFCQLFGTMMDLPKGFPMYCNDIKQECVRLGNPELPKQEKGNHDALQDARWNKRAYEFLKSYKPVM
jgi:hypothetical protein